MDWLTFFIGMGSGMILLSAFILLGWIKIGFSSPEPQKDYSDYRG